MNSKGIIIGAVFTILLLGMAAWLIFFFNSSLIVDRFFNKTVKNDNDAQQVVTTPSKAIFNPPALEDAPEGIREAVMIGYKIMTETKKYAGEYVGNDLSCTNCHFEGGRSKDSISLVGVAATYPHYRGRRDYSADLTLRTQGCFERSMNGTAPPYDSQIMQSLKAYYFWISKDIPIYSDVPWLTLPGVVLEDYKPDVANGEKVFKRVCTKCHGENGTGSDIAPPLWGEGSFNDGAGMHKIKHFSAFSYRFMPKGNPTLTKEEAMDVAGYQQEQMRPEFVATHPNKLERTISLDKEVK